MSNDLPISSAFGGEPPDRDGQVNPGFGITSASGYGLKSVYTRWYMQNHLQLISDAEKTKFLSNEYIHKFLEANPAVEDTDDEERSPRVTSRSTLAQISAFKEKLANSEKLRNDYLSLCKTNELGSDIPYDPDLIDKFADFMGLKGLVASRNIAETSTPQVIDAKLVQELLDGNVQAGVNLRRFMSIKLLQNFTFGVGDSAMKVYKSKYDHTLEIDKRSLPSLNPVADVLWQARIDKDLFQQDAAQMAGMGTANLGRCENGKYLHPTAPFLHKLLTLYQRTDLYDDEKFMRAVINVSPTLNPLGYQLESRRYKLGLSKEDFAKKIGIVDTYKYWTGQGLPSPETFKNICDVLGPASFLNNPAVMQQVVDIDKEKQPFAYHLRFNRYKKGLHKEGAEDAAGIGRSVIGNYEDNAALPDPKTFKKISDFFGPADFMDNPAVLQQFVAIDKTQNPFGYQVRLDRLKKGLYAHELAAALGMSPSVINHYEEGLKLPSQATFKKLCDFLGAADFVDNPAIMKQVTELDKDIMPFSYQLRVQMYKNGMNSQSLANAVGKSVTSTSAYENGDRYPQPDTVEKICAVLGWDKEEATALQKAQAIQKPGWKMKVTQHIKTDPPKR